MIRSLIKLGLFLVVGILVYNYFLGDTTEKEQSKAIFNKARDLGRDAWGLLRSEKEKFDEGKYDEAVDKVEGLFSKLRNTAKDLNDSKALERLSELEKRREELENLIATERPQGYDKAEKRKIEDDWTDLMRDTEDLMEDMENRPPDGG